MSDEPSPGRPETILWCEFQYDTEVSEQVVQLWSPEILFNDGSGLAGPFFERRADAEALIASRPAAAGSKAIFETQLVGTLCALSKSADLVRGGDAEYRRLSHFWQSPVRAGSVIPGSEALDDAGDEAWPA